MAITKEQAIDILDRFDMFQGQRAGRELWFSKPEIVQNQDIADFTKGIASLKDYINKAEDVVPRSEYEELKAKYEKQELWAKLLKAESHAPIIAKAKQEFAKEIFEEIDDIRLKYYEGLYTGEQATEKYLEVEKKYIGD